VSEQIRTAAQADVPAMAALAGVRREQTTGARLLRAALAVAEQRGAVQAVVVTAHLDEPKREALRACGLEIASEWWVTPKGLRSG
jgi:hypothetical protein